MDTVELSEERATRESSGSAPASVDPGTLLGLVEGSDAGLALFGPDHRLVYANDKYRELCGYTREETTPGTPLGELARLSLTRNGEDSPQVEMVIRRGLDRLLSHGGYSFRHRMPSGADIYVHRRVTSTGEIVETVREALEQAEPQAQALGNQMELLAQTARNRMVQALESMADGFALYDTEDRLVYYNRRYVELNSHIADEIAPGKTFEMMLRIGVERNGYETGGLDTETFVRLRVERHRDPGDPYDLKMFDGRWIRVQERRTADGGIVSIRSDITELRQREAEILRVSGELRRRNLQFDTALNRMVQGLCMFDPDQTLLVCNQRYLELYGFSPDVVKPGVKLEEIMAYSISIGNYSREDAQRAREARPDQARLRTQATLKQYLRDGRVIAVMHQPMEDGGSIATYQDITEIERYQESLRRYTKQLEVSNRELQDFAYVASHDLQEPLRKIETFGSRLVDKYGDSLPDGGKIYVERMQNATSRMRLLINDLLSYSRVTTKAKPFKEVDLGACLEGVVGDLQMRIEETDASVEWGVLPTIDADPTQMRQLLQNLVGNALKFRKPDVRPVVTVTAKTLQGDPVDGRSDRVELRIADNGIGFDNKYKEQIFTIFQRLHGRTEYEGTGIGLATVRKIVERHGGAIDADGVEGEGATFIVELPIRQETPEDAGPVAEESADA